MLKNVCIFVCVHVLLNQEKRQIRASHKKKSSRWYSLKRQNPQKFKKFSFQKHNFLNSGILITIKKYCDVGYASKGKAYFLKMLLDRIGGRSVSYPMPTSPDVRRRLPSPRPGSQSAYVLFRGEAAGSILLIFRADGECYRPPPEPSRARRGLAAHTRCVGGLSPSAAGSLHRGPSAILTLV